MSSDNLMEFEVPDHAWGTMHTHLVSGRNGLYGDYSLNLTHPLYKPRIIPTPDSVYLIPQNPSVTDPYGMGVTETCALY